MADLSDVKAVMTTQYASQVNKFLEAGWFLIDKHLGTFTLGWRKEGEPIRPEWSIADEFPGLHFSEEEDETEEQTAE